MTRYREAMEQLAGRGARRGPDALFSAILDRLDGSAEGDALERPTRPGRSRTRRSEAPAAPRGPSRRVPGAVVAGVAFVVTVGLGAMGFWMAGGGESPSTTVATVADSGPEPTAPALVPASGWPSPVLDPVSGLPACQEGSEELAAFIAREFPDAAAASYEAVGAAEVAGVVAMPRIGALSLFSESDVEGACLVAGRRGQVYGWSMQGASGGLIATAAATSESTDSVPPEVIGEYYHQSRTASWHGFNVSVDPEARLWGLIGGNFTVLEAPGLFDGRGEDVHLLGEWLGASLVRLPFDVDHHRGSRLASPEGLPEGYGLCLLPPFFAGELERYAGVDPSGELEVAGYCTSESDYLLIHLAHAGGGLDPPDGAISVPVGSETGATWTEGNRRIVAVGFPESSSEAGIWVEAPVDLPNGALADVLASTLLLNPGIVEPRAGGGDYREALNDGWLQGIVTEAGADRVTIPDYNGGASSVTFDLDDEIAGQLVGYVEERHDPVGLAFAVGATGTEFVDPVDVMVRDSGDAIQMLYTCGGVVFNVSYSSNANPPVPHDWSDQPGRYERALGFTAGLIDAAGCFGGQEDAGGES